MTPMSAEQADSLHAKLAKVRQTKAQREAKAEEMLRLKIKTHLASERLHKAAIALREATPGR
jgi:hypothetical protein